ncbi:MAG: hypothetical protein U0132_20635 [Gemmatimonadaceae bacterium]
MELTVHGESILTAPFTFEFFEVDDSIADFAKRMGPGYVRTPVTMRKTREVGAGRARLVSSSSSGAMIEINFVVEADRAPAVSLTYRFHANGQVDLSSDERPWSGRSPCSRTVCRSSWR